MGEPCRFCEVLMGRPDGEKRSSEASKDSRCEPEEAEMGAVGCLDEVQEGSATPSPPIAKFEVVGRSLGSCLYVCAARSASDVQRVALLLEDV